MTEWHPLKISTSTFLKDLNKDAEQRARECEPALVPSLEHLVSKDYHNVYEPSDDTFLLLDALHYEVPLLKQEIACTLEIGCGTGVPTVYLASELKRKDSSTSTLSLVTDVNPTALRVAERTAQANGVSLETVHCDLASALLPRFTGCVDILLFNPPYVPTRDDEVGGCGIEASWAGGLHGRRVVDRALPQMAQLLKRPHGMGYLITVDDNSPEQLFCQFDKLGLDMKPLLRRRVRNEYLTVQKLTWKDATQGQTDL